MYSVVCLHAIDVNGRTRIATDVCVCVCVCVYVCHKEHGKTNYDKCEGAAS